MDLATATVAEAKALRTLAELALRALGAEEGGVLIAERDGFGRHELVFAIHLDRSGVVEQSTLVGERILFGSGLTGTAALNAEVQIGSPKYGDLALPDGRDPTMLIAAPMLVKDYAVGVLTAVTFEGDRSFSRADAETLLKAAVAAGALVEQWRQRAMFDAWKTGASLPLSGTRAEEHEIEIIRSVQELIRAHPTHLPDIAKLIRVVDGIARGSAR